MTNQLEKFNQIVSISSLEIAKITGKNHFDVLRDIRNIISELELTESNFAGSYKDSSGKANLMFILPKREALILASGYSIKLRTLIIDKLEELSKPQIKELSRMDILTMAIESEKKVLELEAKIERDAPRLEFYDTCISKEGLYGIRETAKLLGIPQNKFVDLMKFHKILYRDKKGNLQPYTWLIEEKLSQLKIADRGQYASIQTLFTKEGVEYIKLQLKELKTL